MRLNQTIFIFLILLVACQSRDVRPKGTGTEYFPLKVGTFWVYDVAQTNFTQLSGQTSSSYQLKVQITDSVPSARGFDYVMERFQRSASGQPWTSIETWSAEKDQFQAVLREGNVPYIKLTFPFSDGKSWDGNALNTKGGTDRCSNGSLNCENYVIADWMKRFEGTNVSFEDSVTILENNDDDPIVKKDVRKSVYARSVGLVYREVTTFEYCTVGDCIGKQVVENGIVLKQTINDYGGL
ncbi:MAG: hypothetical protein WDN75_01290 [Bacteroidota bacterium]